MKKAFKITTVVFAVIVGLIIILTIAGLSYFFVSTKDVKLDLDKLDGNYSNVQIYDNKNNQIMLKNNNYSTISEVSPYIIDTFVSVEDKRFFKHNGIDVMRMISAALKNIGSKSFKEGASTITQQLIKNTHLTNDKTFKRKLSEIKLALKLEKQLSKEQIIEKYLNNLYFGSGIYGVHDACLAFFNKLPKDVNLSEAAMLVGVVKNPAKNSPITNLQGAYDRQKVIFSVLKNNNTFDENTIQNAQNTQITLKNGLIHNKMYKSFINNAIFESTLLLGMDEKEIANSGFKIVTYLDSELQNKMYNEINSYDKNYNYVRASIDNSVLGVTSYISNLSQVDSDIKRQAGSIMKPFSVYLPAYENKLINSLTPILDEKVNFNGYSPSNFNNVYHGYVTVKDAVAHSYNIPAVKLLNELGIDTSVDFLSRFNIKVNDNSKNLTLALGANSVSPLQIAACYSAIANDGNFGECRFVKQIIDNEGKIIYSRKTTFDKVIDSDINYLMLDNLKGSAKYGTGSKLKDFPFDIACKTGTVATSDGNNTDSWCCAITLKDTFIAWDGAKKGEFLEKKHTGSGFPTMSIKDYMNFAYQSPPSNFERPSDIVDIKIDYDKLINEHIVVAVPNNFEGNTISSIFSKNNLPKMTTYNVEFDVKHSLFEDIIEFSGVNNAKYNIYTQDNEEKVLINSVICNGEIVRLIIKKDNIFKNYQYVVEFEQD